MKRLAFVHGFAIAPVVLIATIATAQPVAVAPLPAQPAESWQSAVASAPAGTRFGLLVVDAEGREIAALDADKRFIPASNTKIITTVAALARLGEHGSDAAATTTTLELTSSSHGAADVVLRGRGAALLSSKPDCVVRCLAALAQAVRMRTRRVNAVVGDATWLPDQRWSPGMSWNNIGSPSGTAIAALVVDDNEVPVAVTATAPGQPATITVSSYFTVINQTMTVEADGETRLVMERQPNSRKLRVYGRMAAGRAPYLDRVSPDDPADYAAWMLVTALRQAGVKVTGAVRSQYRDLAIDGLERKTVGQGDVIATLLPPELAEEVAAINLPSQNLHAELLLRRLGATGEGDGSIAAGLAVVEQVLAGAGVPRAGFDFSDGSGMSTYNRLSPRAAVTLLRWSERQPWGAVLRASFPTGGASGTLTNRFKGTLLAGKIFAKTGTLNATNALSGWMMAKSGKMLTFSIFANDVPNGQSAVAAMDRALLAIAAAN